MEHTIYKNFVLTLLKEKTFDSFAMLALLMWHFSALKIQNISSVFKTTSATLKQHLLRCYSSFSLPGKLFIFSLFFTVVKDTETNQALFKAPTIAATAAIININNERLNDEWFRGLRHFV